MNVADDQQVPTVYLLVESAADADLMRHLLAYADVQPRVMHSSSEMGRGSLVSEKMADHELVVVPLSGQRPPAELVSTIAAMSRSSRPVLLLAMDRETASGWPPALQNVPVIFADGDAEAVGKRLRATIQIMVGDYKKMLADRARRAARAQRSAASHQVASRDLAVVHSGRETVRKPDLSGTLIAGAIEKLADADALVEDFLEHPSTSDSLPRESAERLSHLVARAREDLTHFFKQRFDAHLVEQPADRALEAPDSAFSRGDIVRQDRRWDVAIWVDALGSPSFNPVLVKFGRDRDQKAGLLESMSELDLLFGLYVPVDSRPAWELVGGSIVVSIGARQLTDLSKRQFRRLMVETRDRLVHAQL